MGRGGGAGRRRPDRRFDACQAPENARSFLRDARTSYGFSLAYDRAYAAAHPFEADLSLGEDAKFLRSAAAPETTGGTAPSGKHLDHVVSADVWTDRCAQCVLFRA